MDETEWQQDAQAKRVLAIFAGENPWRDDFEMAMEHSRSADPESLYNCGSRGPFMKDVGKILGIFDRLPPLVHILTRYIDLNSRNPP